MLLLTIIMSNERPPDHTRLHKIAGSFKGKLSSLLPSHLSRAPSSIDTDSSSDNSTKRVTGHFINYYLTTPDFQAFCHLTMASVVGVSVCHYGSIYSIAPVSAPVSALILAVPKQLGSTPGDHAAFTIVVANCWSFKICLRLVCKPLFIDLYICPLRCI